MGAPPSLPNSVISALGVNHSYRARPAGRRRGSQRRPEIVHALRGLELDVPTGDWIALLGPNGSGKSTFLRLLATGARPSSGTVRVFGDATAAQTRRRLGVVFQRPALDPLLTIRENLELAGRLYGLGPRDRRARSEATAGMVAITDRLDDRVGILSGGLARRADLARALVGDPDLLLLDEASVGLDPSARRVFLDVLRRARSSRPGRTIVSATHLMDEAEQAETVVMMAEGRVVASGAPEALRHAMGRRLLRVHAEPGIATAILGAPPNVPGPGWPVYESDDDRLVDAWITSLRQRETGFELGPPTLEDVYLKHTGAGLGPEGGSA